jgi:hypothetical protein
VCLLLLIKITGNKSERKLDLSVVANYTPEILKNINKLLAFTNVLLEKTKTGADG